MIHQSHFWIYIRRKWKQDIERYLHPMLIAALFTIAKMWSPLVAQTLKNLPAMQETWVLSLGREDTVEKGMATHSSILARIIPRTEDPGRPQSKRSQKVRHYWTINAFTQDMEIAKYLSADELINKMWCVYTMEYHLTTRKKEILPFVAT